MINPFLAPNITWRSKGNFHSSCSRDKQQNREKLRKYFHDTKHENSIFPFEVNLKTEKVLRETSTKCENFFSRKNSEKLESENRVGSLSFYDEPNSVCLHSEIVFLLLWRFSIIATARLQLLRDFSFEITSVIFPIFGFFSR